MIKTQIVFTDKSGKDHVCREVGETLVVNLERIGSVEESILYTIRAATNDSSVRPVDAKVAVCPNPNVAVYKVDTYCGSYFAKIYGNKLHVKCAELYPISSFGDSNQLVLAKQVDETHTIFYLADRYTKERCGPYHIICW